ncbi:MAG TPA: hypothetical protein VKT18_06690 [Acidimicrobiales bacterium]|nr:hypothetical protein [Acidimicrobiales bacterium]
MPRLDPEAAAEVLARAEPIPTERPAVQAPRGLSGVDLSGSSLSVPLDRPTVVLFVATGCDGCDELVALVRAGVDGFQVVGVLRPSTHEPEEARRAFTGTGGTWLVGDEPFEALQVRSAPFFSVVVDGAVVCEGVGFGAAHLLGHLDRIRAGSPAPDLRRLDPRR